MIKILLRWTFFLWKIHHLKLNIKQKLKTESERERAVENEKKENKIFNLKGADIRKCCNRQRNTFIYTIYI